MARNKLQTMKVLTGRTPNEVILTDELKEHLAITDSYDGNPPWITHKSLPKRFLSWLSELRFKGSKR